MKRRKLYIKPRTDIFQMETDAVLIDPSKVNYGDDNIPIKDGNPTPPWLPTAKTWTPEQTYLDEESPLYTWPSQKSLWED